ncbi:peptidase U35 phage prohead HK97 [Gluconacetobacter diazotrophicus PA1 5]|uniref:HK97 family phage prohead protease n=1 Tax=Gluconacetobacter diazotrophicus TaxID=33996 RepID=UPI000173B396|nr:HK97 family phage prohead protease [Gluconacetobacter diazotrophicus]ACI50358.1 peptidase U35 phage prohead HK97 [Gluconacetobacter diazotrophicus PA1 5]
MARTKYTLKEYKRNVDELNGRGDVSVMKDFIFSISDSNENTATFIITTPETDRANDNVITSGIDVSNYLNNPVVLWGHDDEDFPIGKCISLDKNSDRIIATVKFADFSTPIAGVRAACVHSLITQGILNAVSIGFRPIESYFNDDGGFVIEKSELLEFSVVNIPCHQDALILDHTSEDTDSEESVLDESVEDDSPAEEEISQNEREKQLRIRRRLRDL